MAAYYSCDELAPEKRRTFTCGQAGGVTRDGEPCAAPGRPDLEGRCRWHTMLPVYAVYQIDFSDGYAYVGVTSRQPEDRIPEHFGLIGPRGEWVGDTGPVDGYGRPGIAGRAGAWTWSVLADRLLRRDAYKMERDTIRLLPRPINRLNARRT